MPRGRGKKDDPRDEALRGFPSKRRRKTEAAIAELEAAAEAQARAMADKPPLPSIDDLQSFPSFLLGERLDLAREIWLEYAPRLDRLNLLTTLDRYTFAMFCLYAAEFEIANKSVNEKGYAFAVPTVAKTADGKPGMMLRENPSVFRRDHAAKMMMQIGEKFGFTPSDRNKLIREHAMRMDEEVLFGRVRTQPPAAPLEPSPGNRLPPELNGSDPVEIIGSLAALDSAPPKSKMN